MIFSELYGAYYNTVAKILSRAVLGTLTDTSIRELVEQNAFSESVLSIIPALKSEHWQLLLPDLSTPLTHTPTLPLTTLQKRWLKAVVLDPRIKLFDIHFDFDDDIKPLFTSEDYVVFDKYSDGDNFGDEEYIRNFRTILSALKEKTALCIEHLNRHNKAIRVYVMPERLEYSEKDDKFRLITAGCHYGSVINLGRIIKCKPHPYTLRNPSRRQTASRSLVMEITDQRNTLERAMLHFAHFKKQARKIADDKYRITIDYEENDETELLIRVLSFGPFIKVLEPSHFVELIKQRLRMQKSCGL